MLDTLTADRRRRDRAMYLLVAGVLLLALVALVLPSVIAEARPRVDLSGWAPYAEAMAAFHRGDRDAYMVVYDDYERDEVPLSYFFRDSNEFPELERLALDLCRGRVLDVGAGSGCHTLALQERGFQVTAIEILPEMVDILKARGVRDARHTTWMDLLDDPFDTVLMMMNGLGLSETLPGLRRFFRRARRLVRPDGQVLADSTTCGCGWSRRPGAPATQLGAMAVMWASSTFRSVPGPQGSAVCPAVR